MPYLPFLDGKYSVAPALLPIRKVEQPEDKLVFQIDEDYNRYLKNKEACRLENIHKYYCEERLNDATAVAVNKLIVDQLLKEHPEDFKLYRDDKSYTLYNKRKGEYLYWKQDWLQLQSTGYVSLFDGLVCQIQEDVAICQLSGDSDWLAAVHICSPNHWDPAAKAGKPFNTVHAVVPGMEKTMPNYFKMLLSVVNKGPFTRFAWGISTDDHLNHHPLPPPDANEDVWKGRRISEGCELFVRVEKQNLLGIPEVNAFLFTIRTYFYPVSGLAHEEKAALVAAVESMSEQALIYKGLSGQVDLFKRMVLNNS